MTRSMRAGDGSVTPADGTSGHRTRSARGLAHAYDSGGRRAWRVPSGTTRPARFQARASQSGVGRLPTGWRRDQPSCSSDSPFPRAEDPDRACACQGARGQPTPSGCGGRGVRAGPVITWRVAAVVALGPRRDRLGSRHRLLSVESGFLVTTKGPGMVRGDSATDARVDASSLLCRWGNMRVRLPVSEVQVSELPVLESVNHTYRSVWHESCA
jgi:hypothetical protein